jgi:protein-disulfide isomerase/uncharacterized membrane protein
VKKSFIISLLLTCAGIFVSMELVNQSASFAASGEVGCIIGNQGCLKAASSEFAALFGQPISIFGLSFYIAAALLCIVGLFWRSEQEALERVFFLGSTLAVVYSIFLAAVSFSGGYLCPYCATLYGINIGLFITAFVAYPKRKTEGFATLKSIPKSMAFWTAVLLMLASFPTSKYAYVKEKLRVRAEQKIDDVKKHATTEELKKHLAETQNAKQTQPTTEDPKPQDNDDLAMQLMPKPIAFETRNRALRGNPSAPITLVEFSDFECPYCQRFGLSLKAALKTAPNSFNYVFKHFPLDNKCNPSIEGDFHKFSCEGAYAMICAGRDGKEWAMHDLIFDNQRNLKAESFLQFAQELGISLDAFKTCIKAPETRAIVMQDITEGIKAGINGTPAVYLNGMPMAPELDGEKLGQLLKELSGQMK